MRPTALRAAVLAVVGPTKLCLSTSILVMGLGACAHQRSAPDAEPQGARAGYAHARDASATRLEPAEPPQETDQGSAPVEQTRQEAGATAMQARPQDAQARLREVRESVSRIGSTSVHDDKRGMVISVQSEVLFDTDKADLRPVAKCQLDQIAGALGRLDRPIAVFGNTDGTGSRARSMELSQDRARAVRDYLVSRGIPGDAITAKGLGPDHPVAENATTEGRAHNRRVEIIVAPNRKRASQPRE
jgi:outer membrane protein OmpA-like peptidoglycan-associated protein